jgi:hypothetical protein
MRLEFPSAARGSNQFPTLAMAARFQLSAFSAQRLNISIVISAISYSKTSLQNAQKSRIKNLSLSLVFNRRSQKRK